MASHHQTSIIYVLPRLMGGVTNVMASLLQHRVQDEFQHRAVLTNNRLVNDTRYEGTLPADATERFEYTLPTENVRSVFARLARTIGSGAGVLVANDWIELATLAYHETDRTVIHVVHGDHDYYHRLAVDHDVVIDAYVATSRSMFENLQRLLPHRENSIFHIPFGVPIPEIVRQPSSKTLRLFFAGRVCESKGVFDLPKIDRRLLELGVSARWTIVGDGPATEELIRAWNSRDRVRFTGQKTNREVIELAAQHDAFVMPTRAEGLGAALLEAMSVGLVPVVSNLASGVPEIVQQAETGFCPEVGDIEGFATAIAHLDRNRGRLEAMSRGCRAAIIKRFNVADRTPAFQSLFSQWRELRRERPRSIPISYGSRLDQPWIPNCVVYGLRSSLRHARRLSFRKPRTNSA